MRHRLHNFLAGALLLLLFCAGAFVIARKRADSTAANSSNPAGPELAHQLRALESRENELDRTVWAKEMLAQECGRVFESLWDSLNAATNKFDVLASFQFGELVAGNFGPPKKSGPGIEARGPGGAGQKWSAPQWREFLAESHRAGWELAHAEFRHNRFDTDEAGQPRASRFYFRADLTNAGREERATLEGDLVVDWTPKAPGAELPAVKRIDASRLVLKTRRG